MHSPSSQPSRLDGKTHESVPRRHECDDLTASLLRRLPPEIAKNIIDVPPSQSFQDVESERDRRLRLLIRRYVNQLQYGCLSRNCTTPTCLSFRKRNTKGPVRLYTELSARSLACHLIQEYGKSGKDPKDGLCQNQPVVPWYRLPGSLQSPRSYNRNTKQDLATATNGHVAEPRSHHVSRPGPVEASMSKQPPRELNEPSHQQRRPAGHQCDLPESIKTDGLPLDADTGHNTVCTLPKTAQHVDPIPRRQRFDHASLTQTLLTTRPMQELEVPHTLNAQGDKSPVQQTLPVELDSGRAVNDENGDGKQSDSMDPIWHNTAFCGLAFRRLEWNAVIWLQKAKSQGAVLATSFQMFLCNSLIYSLTNPRRLCESAVIWRTLASTDLAPNYSLLPDSTYRIQQSRRACSDEGGRQLRETTGSGQGNQRLDTTAKLDLDSILHMFHNLLDLSPEPNSIWSNLRVAVQQCYASLPIQPLAKTRDRMPPSRHSSVKSNSTISPSTYLGKMKTSETLAIVILAMISPLLYKLHGQWQIERPGDLKRPRISIHGDLEVQTEPTSASESVSTTVRASDMLDNWQFLDLSTSLMDCLSHQLAADAIRNTRYATKAKKYTSIVDKMLDHMSDSFAELVPRKNSTLTSVTGLAILEMTRNAFVQSWNRDPVIKRTSSVGGALQLMHHLHHWRGRFSLAAESFEMALVSSAITDMDMPSQWVTFEPSGAEMHILSFPFLFNTSTLVKYFRTINIIAMRRSYEAAATVHSDAKGFLRDGTIPIYGPREVLAGMRAHMAKYFVLTVRRSHLLEDAISQIWRRERQEVLRPLRVRLGRDEGEDGLDHGGVQQEFLRLAFAEAFDPNRGMFTLDDRSYAWFQPGSYEPLYKFEAIGILMSLALYNSISLPITMPLAFYRRLLGMKVKKLDDIKDGWPDLARGLQYLLDFDGDVAEVIGRTYEFSYDFAGTTISVDMQKDIAESAPPARLNKPSKEKVKSTSFELPVQLDLTPPSQSPVREPRQDLSRTPSIKGISTPLSLESDVTEAALVTNENREQYVKDYIHYLTDQSIRQQWEAFAKGFFTCIDRKSLSLFTPQQLALVVEGHRNIDIDKLERAVTYEDFDKSSPYISEFWEVIRDFTPEQHRQLLEFVTASDRVPITGEASLHFTIQRQWEDTHLPSSSTCYHRLLLPQYANKEVLAAKLSKALEHCMGFGTI
ncbi:hypothetical protein DV736_g3861, partial [Chaetothyriales sp. CBS 134916]